MQKFLAFTSFGVLLSTVVLVLTVLWFQHAVDETGPSDSPVIYDVPKGASVKSIARTLENKGVIESALIFEVYARVRESDKPLQAGEYHLKPGVSIKEVLHKLRNGDVILHQITIPEGLTNYQIRALINDNDVLTGNITDMPPEGYLLPETYSFRKGLSRQDMVDRMNKAKKDLLSGLWPQRQRGLPIDTMHEAVTLASIVEKETAVADERDKVAGVFINRLQKGMRLQSDPTVIYALTDGKPEEDGKGPLGRRLLRKDLQIDSPYNTYKYAGLTPGPICNPGKESLEAVLNPQEHDYIYFVADGSGGHAFARTLDEHNKNVAAWRKIRRQQEAQ